MDNIWFPSYDSFVRVSCVRYVYRVFVRLRFRIARSFVRSCIVRSFRVSCVYRIVRVKRAFVSFAFGAYC